MPAAAVRTASTTSEAAKLLHRRKLIITCVRKRFYRIFGKQLATSQILSQTGSLLQ